MRARRTQRTRGPGKRRVSDRRNPLQPANAFELRCDAGAPLLVVYAAATHGAAGSERFTGLTREAIGRGLIVAYLESRPLSRRMIRVLAEIPGIIEKDWCIDHGRIYLTGHSDGATASAAIVFLSDIDLDPGAIAISAPGIRQIDLAQYDCPAHGDDHAASA